MKPTLVLKEDPEKDYELPKPGKYYLNKKGFPIHCFHVSEKDKEAYFRPVQVRGYVICLAIQKMQIVDRDTAVSISNKVYGNIIYRVLKSRREPIL